VFRSTAVVGETKFEVSVECISSCWKRVWGKAPTGPGGGTDGNIGGRDGYEEGERGR
jgi:hypothetical protein